jgi:WD40 repeat protein
VLSIRYTSSSGCPALSADVVQVCWSADSRIVVSASKDSTIKLWNFRTKKMLTELPGHADEVYSLDWSPDGESIVSGGKDRVLKMYGCLLERLLTDSTVQLEVLMQLLYPHSL